jgi:uncharacterized membrane protein
MVGWVPASARDRRLLGASVALMVLFGYAVFRSVIIGFVRLPGIPGGLTSLTAILALFSLTHSWYSLGGRLTAVFFLLSAIVSWTFEEAGVATGLVYGAYHYTAYLGWKLGSVPVLIPLAWFMMIYPSYVIANLVLERRAVGTARGLAALVRLAAVSAAVMTLWDLVIDPILSGPKVQAWIWETGGPYFGVPIHNYFGWLLTTFTVYVAFRALDQRVASRPSEAADWRAAAMPVMAYGLMLIGDLASGVTPPGIAAIGPVVMGLPVLAAAWRLAEMRAASGVAPTSAGRDQTESRARRLPTPPA